MHTIFRLPLVTLLISFKSYVLSQNEDTLFLTPLIKAGNIAEAQRLSQVEGFYPGITSYSGYITVNEEYNSNLFFWFFPAQNNPSEAPVFLWSEGGPAITGMHSIFNHNGPFFVDKDQSLRARNNSWHLTQNIIYLDNPVGVGFSFTQSEEGYINSGVSAAPDLYEFLVQFFKLFPNLQENDFYNGGVSYGATYASVLANYIHTKNQANPEVRINLKGVLLESPWIDPVTQADYGTYLFNVALIDDKTKEDCDRKRDVIRKYISQESYLDAFGIWSKLIGVDITSAVGYSPLYNIIKDTLALLNYTDLIASDSGRQSLHVGNTSFSWVSQRVQSDMHTNFMASVRTSLEAVLTAGYRTIIYVGNLDVITGHLGVREMVENLQWDGKEELINSTRGFWHVDGRVAGYVQSARNVTYIIMRNAGHGCNGDQPEWGLELVHRFTTGLPFE